MYVVDVGVGRLPSMMAIVVSKKVRRRLILTSSKIVGDGRAGGNKDMNGPRSTFGFARFQDWWRKREREWRESCDHLYRGMNVKRKFKFFDF